ncbi:MAG: class I SAM-dependent methyltransferase [Verrucomicrobiota bacterium]
MNLTEPPRTTASAPEDRRENSQIACRTAQGVEVQAPLLRAGRFTAAFEIHPSDVLLRVSEILENFQITRDGRIVYRGNAVVRGLVDFGPRMVCEVGLEESAWAEGAPDSAAAAARLTRESFQNFLQEWEGFYKILPEFKLAVADLHSFLDALRLWLEQIEAGLRALPAKTFREVERETIRELLGTCTPAIGAMFERFECAAAAVPSGLIPAHQAFCRRQLHPLLLCCPFMNRIFTKPLGYAGDYEMMNMIVRNEPEGESLFAKLLQTYILNQAPACAVRNRVDYFVRQFVTETSRVSARGRAANICSLGCGPAREVEKFMAEQALSHHARFRLLDANEETLAHTAQYLERVREKHERHTAIQVVKKPAQFLLKETACATLGDEPFDLIYCSGLYDYLNDRVIKALNTRLYDRLRPGGILIVTNFDPYNPIRHIMEFLFDWFLIHRDGKQLAALAPAHAPAEQSAVRAELSGCNIFLETRKPL